MHEVAVRIPISYVDSIVADTLGLQPLPVNKTDLVLAPYVTINNRVHAPTSDFLRHHVLRNPNISTARRIANDLATWVRFLINECNMTPFEDARDPILTATEEHFARFYRQRQYGAQENMLTPEAWRHAASSIKRLYEFTASRYHHRAPFDIIRFTHRQTGASGTTIAGYKPRRTRTGSAGQPITPHFAQQLLMGALRVDNEGNQEHYRGADRDHAIISLGLGTGLRRHNLANITTYEIPPANDLDITILGVANRVTKNDAGGDAFVLTHRLGPVHDYIDGQRLEMASQTTFAPSQPLRIEEATRKKVTYREPGGQRITRLWTNIDENDRHRLINSDHSSPILFLNEHNGKPLSYSGFQTCVKGAAAFARERINPDFPEGFRLHDLRHTYAVHMTMIIYRGVLAENIVRDGVDTWTVDHISSAVDLVQGSLGHSSEASTRLYIQAAHRFLAIPIEEFLGRN